MSKIAVITDLHFGCRNDSLVFQSHLGNFYTKVFFPYLEENGITQVIMGGDTFDKRRQVNFATLEHACYVYFDELAKRNISVDCIIGNHDTYYKNTNDVNSPSLLLNDYSNINIISKPTVKSYDGVNILLMPWIAPDIADECINLIKQAPAPYMIGHLEIAGFEMYKDCPIDHGLSPSLFNMFEHVWSGHYHHRSTSGNITYLGTPYEMTWSDADDPKGFHVFDTDDRTMTFIKSPLQIYHNIYYQDSSSVTELDPYALASSYVKVHVMEKSSSEHFEHFVKTIDNCQVTERLVIDKRVLNQEQSSKEFVSEDTLTMLRKYANGIETEVNKSKLESLLVQLYNRATAQNETL